jgi:ABC-2 type transport system ATP-binding protein
MALVQAHRLSKKYGSTVAVQDLSFTARPGRVTGFLGPNGAGKSTAMRLMLSLDDGRGRTLFDGVPYRDLRHPARRVGALLDARGCHPWRSAVNHLRMIARGSGIPVSRAEEVLDQVGLGAGLRIRPRGFSLGMSQRLGLAAALLGSPDTLILDEPGNGMDPQGLIWLRTFLQEYAARGNTVFVSSHQLAEMQTLADDVVVIGQGRLLANCATEEFLADFGLETVRVRSDEQARLSAVLRRRGATVRDAPDGSLTVGGLSARQVAEAAAEHSCLVVELFTSTASLEDAFLRASSDSLDYDAKVLA